MPFRSVSSANTFLTGAVASISVPAPAGNAADDVLVGFMAYDSTAGAQTPVLPSGWTLIENPESTIDAADDPGLVMAYRVLTAPIGSQSWGVFSGTSVLGVVIFAFTGVDTADPIDDSDDSKSTVLATSGAVPAMTAALPGAQAVYGWAVRGGGGGADPAIDLSEDLSHQTFVSMGSELFMAAGEMGIDAAGALASLSALWTPSTSWAAAGVVLNQLNVAPNAPNWVTEAGAYDVADPLVLEWEFSDDNVGDAQSARRIKRILNGVTRWLNAAGTAFDQVAETNNVSASESLSLAAGWAASGDSLAYYVATRDTIGSAWGPYSAALNITPSAVVNPTLTEPDAGDTVTTGMVTGEYTVAEQTARRFVLYDADDVILYDTGKETTDDTTPYQVPYMLTNATDYSLGLTTWNDEDLESVEDVNAFDTDFEEPAEPTLVVTADTPTGAITVAITNPAPGVGEADFLRNALYKREVGTTGDGTRIATGLAEDASYIDWVVKSGGLYEYRAVAESDIGTFTTSGWES